MPTIEMGMGEEDWRRDMQQLIVADVLADTEVYVRRDGRTIYCVGFAALCGSFAPQHRN